MVRLSDISRLLVLLTCISSVLFAMGTAYAEDTITVGQSGCNYVTIWEAIDAANPGDTIEVQSNTYYENVIVDIQLILRGVDTGSGLPIIDAGGRRDAITLYADGITIEGFVATNSGNDFSNDAGIKVISNNNNIKYNRVINNNANGIRLVESNGNTILGNTADDNTYHGIDLENSNDNLITYNSANNSEYPSGIMLYYSNNNVVMGNTVCANGRYGIQVEFSKENLIYKNNLINNEDSNAHEHPYPNEWDDGAIGNHYGDFDEPAEGCKDRNKDGICDFECTISGSSSVDRYPTISPQISNEADPEDQWTMGEIAGPYTAEITGNQRPLINSLDTTKASPQTAGESIIFNAKATDADGDLIYYQFWQSGPATSGIWRVVRTWGVTGTWMKMTSSSDIGNNQFRVWVKDDQPGHADETNFDDEKVINFQITAPATTTSSSSGIGSSTTISSSMVSGGPFVGSKNSDVYHYPWCASAKRIKSSNKVTFATSAEARARGYRPCSKCHPP